MAALFSALVWLVLLWWALLGYLEWRVYRRACRARRRTVDRIAAADDPTRREPGTGPLRCGYCQRTGFTRESRRAHQFYYHAPRPGPEDRPEWSNR